MDNLKVKELREKLCLRGMITEGNQKPQVEAAFEELQRGITNVPVLLQGTPNIPLTELGLERYKISPIEPLHDLKGHLCNN